MNSKLSFVGGLVSRIWGKDPKASDLKPEELDSGKAEVPSGPSFQLRLPDGWDRNTTEDLDEARRLKRSLQIVREAKSDVERVAAEVVPLDQASEDMDPRSGHVVVVDGRLPGGSRYDAKFEFLADSKQLLSGECVFHNFFPDFNSTVSYSSKIEPAADGSCLVTYSEKEKERGQVKVRTDAKVEVGANGTLRLLEDANPPWWLESQ